MSERHGRRREFAAARSTTPVDRSVRGEESAGEKSSREEMRAAASRLEITPRRACLEWHE